MRVVFSAARQQSLFVPRTPFLAQTLKQFYVSSPSHLFTKPFLLIFRTVVQSPRYGRRRVKIFNLEGIQILRHVMVVVLLFPSFLGCAFLRRRRRRRHQNRVRSEDNEESARRTNGFSLPHEEWVPGDGMKQQDSASHIFQRKKKWRRFYASRAFLFWFECKKYYEPRNASIFSLSQKCPAQKKKRRTPRSLTARVVVSSKRSGRNSPVIRRRGPFFFFCINGFRARGELNSWNLLSPRDVEEKKTTREDGSTTNNSRAGKERR